MMNHHCTGQPRGRSGAMIVVAAAILAISLAPWVSSAAAQSPGTVNDRDCPSTAPYKIQIDNDVFCKTPAEFCAGAPYREDCQTGWTAPTLAPGQMRPPFSDDSIEVPGPVDGSRCPPSNPVATQVDDRLVCFTLPGFCETRNPTWYDPTRNLYCPGATSTTSTPPASAPASVNAPLGSGALSPTGVTEVRPQSGNASYVISPAALSVDGSRAGGQPALVTVRAMKAGARTVAFTLRVRGNRPIEIPSALSRKGYRIAIFVDGVQVMVIPPRT